MTDKHADFDTTDGLDDYATDKVILPGHVYRNMLAETARLKGVLRDARMQIEYLHDKFRETGTGNAIIARINDAVLNDGSCPQPHDGRACHEQGTR